MDPPGMEVEEEVEDPTSTCSSRMGASFDLRYLGKRGKRGKRRKNMGVKRGQEGSRGVPNRFVKGEKHSQVNP